MDFLTAKTAYLILPDGTVFKGKSFGAEGEVIGEVVFTTAMTGYQETLTDPSYCGQIVTQTFPLIGNYGINSIDKESEGSVVSGYIVREYCKVPSNFRCEKGIDEYLKENGIIGLETALPLAITNLLETGALTISEIIEKMSLNPARLYHLNAGTLSIGAPADVVVFDTGALQTAGGYASKSSNSPFTGKKLKGSVRYTIINGIIKYNSFGCSAYL